MKTKSLFFVLFLILFSNSLSFAQARRIGIKGGLAIGSPIGPHPDSATGKLGVGTHFGFYLKEAISKRFDIQAEVLFSHKRATFRTPIEGDTSITKTMFGTSYLIPSHYKGWVRGEFSNQYIEIPIQLLYHASHKFSFLLGPQLSYLVSGSNTGLADITVGDNYSHVTDQPFDQSTELNKWDYGVVGGTTYGAERGLNFGLTFSYGLRSIYKSSYTKVDDTIRNIYMQFALGYTFGSSEKSRF